MLLNFSRILLNAADGSPGGGSPSGPTTPPTPQAQAASPSFVTKDDLKSFAEEMRNGLFADLRRAGALGKDSKPKRGDEAPASEQPPVTQAGPDPMKLRELDRAVARLGGAAKLSDAAYKRMERAFVEEGPGDAATWAKEYLGDFGIAPQTAGATTPSQTTTHDPNRQPVSNAGGVPGSAIPLEERSLIGMSESDVNHLIKTKGLQWYARRYTQDMRGRRILIK